METKELEIPVLIPTKSLKLDLQFFGDGVAGEEAGNIVEPNNSEPSGGEEFQGGTIIGANNREIVRGFYNPEEEIEYPNGENPLYAEDDNVEPNFVEDQAFGQVDPNQLEGDPQNQQIIGQPNPNEQFMQQLIQENQRIQYQMQQLMMNQQMMNQQQFQQPQIGLPPAEPEVSPEEMNEKLMEKFYDNPSEFFKEMKQQAIEEARKDFEPIIKERQIETEVQTLSQQYGQDFLDHVPQMQNLVNQLGDTEVERMGLERVYLMARGMGNFNQPQQPQAPQMSADQILQDPDFVNNYLAQNPAIQQAVMNQYMANKQQAAPPRVLGNTAGSAVTLAPENRPKSISEASKLLRKSWGL